MIDMLQTWIEKIRSNNANEVSDLYHKDGLLLGTFSNIERNGQKLILDYFKNLLKSQVNVEIITKHEYKTEVIATASGLYNFILNDKKIEARFSFVFLKTKKKWEILSHHSSILPK
ncbi:MAG: nuclear transport factor 2 family protein [Candidatus Neomarinimicrobiota bacterium]